MFDAFWSLYPKKEAKKYAAKCWERLSKEEKEKALAMLPLHIKKWEAEDRLMQYVPNCSTWINQARFEDEIQIPAPRPKIEAGWWTTEDATRRMGEQYGVRPRGGEDWNAYRARIRDAMRAA